MTMDKDQFKADVIAALRPLLLQKLLLSFKAPRNVIMTEINNAITDSVAEVLSDKTVDTVLTAAVTDLEFPASPSGDFLKDDGTWAPAGGGGGGAHALGGAEHTADTLANLNSKITDATLDDSGDPRDPNAHTHSANDITADTIDGDRLPALSQTKKGGAPATGVPSGKFLKDDATWDTPTTGLTQAQVLNLISLRG